MSRVEMKKNFKQSKKKYLKTVILNIFYIFMVIICLAIGLYTVDKSNRNMLMIEENNLFRYKKLNDNNYEMIFCGKEYEVNIAKVNKLIDDTKLKLEYTLKELEIFAEKR